MHPDPPSSDPSHGDPGASSEPSSLFGRMVEAFGGWTAIDGDEPGGPAEPAKNPAAAWASDDEAGETTNVMPLPPEGVPVERHRAAEPVEVPVAGPGTVLLGRYFLDAPIGRPELRLFLADDRSTRRPVTVQLLSSEGDHEGLMARLRLGRSVGIRSVLRVHDVAATPWGALVVMEAIGSQTLEHLIEQRRASGGPSVEELRRIGVGLSAALAAIHDLGLVHGSLEPGMILVADGVPRLIASQLVPAGVAPSREPAWRTPVAPTPFHSRERGGGAGPSIADDVFAFGMILWSLCAKTPPAPGFDPRAARLRHDALHDPVSQLTADELRQIHNAVSPDPAERVAARGFRFFDSRQSSPSLQLKRTDILHAGAPVGTSTKVAFPSKAMSLLVTYSATAPTLVGELLPLRKAVLSVGRDPHADVSIPDGTVSTEHALLAWRKGAWIINDQRSTNGTYADQSYARQDDMRLRHGGEVQLGELRVMLVSFQPGSQEHVAARAYLARRDGLTRLLFAPAFFAAVHAERRFADWADLPLHLAIFDIHLENPTKRDRLAILELLALRRLARRATELTDTLLVNLRTATAGLVPSAPRKGVLAAPRVVVAWLGVNQAQAHVLLDTMVAELKSLLPQGLRLGATLAAYSADAEATVVIDSVRTKPV